jgi:hypothetical protein
MGHPLRRVGGGVDVLVTGGDDRHDDLAESR